MKTRQLNTILFILSLLPFQVWAQQGSSGEQDLTGMWRGTLFNDTTQKLLTYELAISEEKGKLTGYSYTIFDIDGKKEVGVKKIKIKRKNDELVIEDLLLISNNYSSPPPRGVRQMSVLNFSSNDTIMSLNGRWSTTPTREYRPLTGSMKLERAADFRPVALYQKLEELHLEKDLSFVKTPVVPGADLAKANPPQSTPPVVQAPVQTAAAVEVAAPTVFIPARVEPVAATNLPIIKTKKTGATFSRALVTGKLKNIVSTELPAFIPERIERFFAVTTPLQKPARLMGASFNRSVVSGKLKKIVIMPMVDKSDRSKDIAVNTPVSNQKDKTVAASSPDKKNSAVVKPEEKPKLNPPPAEKPKAPPVVIAAKEAPSKPAVTTKDLAKNAPVKEPVKSEAKKVAEIIPAPVKTDVAKNTVTPKTDPPVAALLTASAPAAEKVAERKMAAMQSVFFEADSLVFTLYDNGDVDGDTVSVLMNGQILFSRQGLTTRANSKTVYTNIGTPDSIMLVMYAENLGSIPPNTGLLMVTDGAATYYVRFTADLQNNAAILLRRKKKE